MKCIFLKEKNEDVPELGNQNGIKSIITRCLLKTNENTLPSDSLGCPFNKNNNYNECPNFKTN